MEFRFVQYISKPITEFRFVQYISKHITEFRFVQYISKPITEFRFVQYISKLITVNLSHDADTQTMSTRVTSSQDKRHKCDFTQTHTSQLHALISQSSCH